MNSADSPPTIGGGGSIWSAGTRTTWLAASTTMPTSLPSTSTTMTRVIEVYSWRSRPNLSRRSMMGITSPLQVDDPLDEGRRPGQAGDLAEADHLLDPQDIQPVFLIAHDEADQLVQFALHLVPFV